jgi:mannose-6-phosphate isomerase-like protein (cupin superfamily)
MTANLVRAGQARRTETPNAVMTTLASPSQGPTSQLSMWLVEMRASQQGPLHVFDAEQIWHLLDGQAEMTVGTQQVMLSPGDAIVLPAGTERQVRARTDVRLVVCGRGDAIVQAAGDPAPRGTPPWIS